MASGVQEGGLTATPIDVGWALSGELDANNAPRLTDLLATDRPDIDGSTVVLDLSAVAFIDSSGLSALLDARRLAEDTSGELVLRNPSTAVSRLLQMTQLEEVFRIDQGTVSAASDRHAE